jgi:nucleotide-binding universal stress UspA family protein
MIKDLLVCLGVAPHHSAAADLAIALGVELDAHVAAVAFAYEPAIPITVMGGVPGDFLDAERAQSEQAARAAKDRFDHAAKVSLISSESLVHETAIAGAADTFGRMARRFDLSLVGQPDPKEGLPENLIIEAALFESGRPVIVVPYIYKTGLKLDRVMVCWDGGRTAARAIGDAMPLLTRAKAVEVVTITGEAGKRSEIPGVDMGEHLARHGLNVEVENLPGTDDVGNALLSYAADISADMIVMGAYGHSRLREFILGGVTRTMLGSMTVPCFMAH